MNTNNSITFKFDNKLIYFIINTYKTRWINLNVYCNVEYQ